MLRFANIDTLLLTRRVFLNFRVFDSFFTHGTFKFVISSSKNLYNRQYLVKVCYHCKNTLQNGIARAKPWFSVPAIQKNSQYMFFILIDKNNCKTVMFWNNIINKPYTNVAYPKNLDGRIFLYKVLIVFHYFSSVEAIDKKKFIIYNFFSSNLFFYYASAENVKFTFILYH